MLEPVTPGEGWGVLHLFLTVDHAEVPHLPPGAAKDLAAVLDRWSERTQLHVFSALGHKADVMLMAIDPDLAPLRALQTDVQACEAAPALELTWSYLSLTEAGEYVTDRRPVPRGDGRRRASPATTSTRGSSSSPSGWRSTPTTSSTRACPSGRSACFYPMSHRREGDGQLVLARLRRTQAADARPRQAAVAPTPGASSSWCRARPGSTSGSGA